MVRTHLKTTMHVQSPFGMRVISKANGDLLDGYSGEYCFGGYWWLHREVRKHLGIAGPDHVEEILDKEPGIVHRSGYLVLDPSMATLRPK